MALLHSLDGIWSLRKSGDCRTVNADVPGSVLTSFLKEGLIGDPFWRMNEYEIREMMMDDFIYEKSFVIAEGELEHDSIVLKFEGVDTIAQIVLNGTVLADVNDMHRTYSFEVKDILKDGENVLRVIIKSALKYVREKDAASDIFYASTGCIHGNGYLRKAHYMFGWDWGPQLPDAGIFRSVKLLSYDKGRIEDVYIVQNHLNGCVDLSIKTECSVLDGSEPELRVDVEEPSGKVISEKGYLSSPLTVHVTDPELWWPNNLGKQPLYRITVSLLSDGAVADSYTTRVGLRTITVSTEKDEYGNEFCFVVNGRKIFAMGANYIPQDSLIPRITTERYVKMVEDAAEANFNCLRVWGGGYYPDDAFYDACDEKGIIIWQDLMFACNVYELTDEFEESIKAETRDNVRRLRHHACLGLWCGNNEMEWGWGDMWARLKGHHPRYKADYTKIFDFIIPRVMKEEDPQTFFWPSSPSSGGNFDEPYSFDRGDQHYWEVWHSGKPFTEYRKNYFRFCSEYGFQSFPSMKTIRSFSLPEDRNIFSKVMECHQKNGVANGKIFSYISDYFRYPSSLKTISYISQVLQLKAIQYGVEHWRRNRPRCMGSLYWQLDDCYPVASWSSIDYYGRWKALHYGARHFYAPVTISACEKEELSSEISYYFHNETLKSESRTVRISLKDNHFNVLFSEERTASADALSVTEIADYDFSDFLSSDEERESRFAVIEMLDDNDVVVEKRTTLFVKPKHFRYVKPEYEMKLEDCDSRYKLTVCSDTFAQYVGLELKTADAVFSDNYFDLTDSDGVVVYFEKNGKKITAEDISVISVADSYEMEED